MLSSGDLQGYLGQFRRRLQLSIASQGLGAAAAAALLLTVVLVYIANRFAFSDASVLSARTALFAGLAAVIVALLVLPLRKLARKGVAAELENQVPAFDGRVSTYVDQTRRQEKGEPANPMLGLLAEDAMKVAQTAPADSIVTTGRILTFAGLGLAALASLVWLGASGPGYWGYGAQRLWAGWMEPDNKPLYELLVEPGDTTVRSGASLRIKAELVGLDSTDAIMYVKYESSVDWEAAPMPPQSTGSGFEFTLTGVNEPFRYYVRAAGLESQQYQVRVVVMPNVENVKLTYNYPDWTGLEPLIEDPGGDIRAVPETKIAVEVQTDKPLKGAVLVVNKKDVPLKGSDLLTKAEFQVDKEGEYYIAAFYDGEKVRLTEDFFITVQPNQKPQVKILKPGRDWRATPIEEVTAHFEASDDFGVRSLELRYSVNGGDWVKKGLAGGNRGSMTATHVFELEELGKIAGEAMGAGGIEILVPGGDQPKIKAADKRLHPGDVITYYVVARDHEHEVQTDMYFIEVQPFNRTFEQSQQGGGGMQGGEQNQQNEISKRQKEIIAATWNLIKERDAGDGRSKGEISESARMLSELQLTLRDQARTLAERTRARELTGTNEKFRLFVENLELAAESMQPASDLLGDLKLQDAVQPEQKALQYLLRAESLFTDIQVAFQQGGGGGGGGGASRDLAEMFELEMDLEKNQYETGGGGGGQQQKLEREIDDAFKKLEELAKRQEALAEKARSQQEMSFAERWQQEMLRREAEELKRELEQLKRESSSQQQASNSQQSQGGAQGQSGQGGQQGQSQEQRQQQQLVDQTIERLERATNQMQQAGGQQGGSPQQGAQQRQSAQQASQELNRAKEQMAEQRRQQGQSALSDIVRGAQDLVDRQAEVQPHLERALQTALEEMRKQKEEGRRGAVPSGLTREEESRLSEAKGEMAEDLQGLERQAQEAIRRLGQSAPDAARKLRGALGELQQSEASTRLQTAADYIRRGGAPYVANSEEGVARALRDFRDNVQEAEQIAQNGGGERGRGDQGGDQLAQALTRMEQLRRDLEKAAGLDDPSGRRGGQQPGQEQGQGGQQGQQQGQGQQGQQGQEGQGQQQGQQGQGQGQQEGQQGQQGQGEQAGQGQPGSQGQQGGQQPGQQQAQQGQGSQPGQGNGQGEGSGQAQQAQGGMTPGSEPGQGGPGGLGGPRRGSGSGNFGEWANLRGGAPDPQTQQQMREAIQRGASELPRLTNQLRQGGVYDEDLAALRKFVQNLPQSRFEGNPELLEREYRDMLSLLEQLELQVRRQVEVGQGGSVRALVADPVPDEYRQAVADYFRKLSEGKGN